ncbi:hypothetical protein MUK42_29571, partial [Musa troglodytarum]
IAASTNQIGQIDEDRKTITEFETINDSEIKKNQNEDKGKILERVRGEQVRPAGSLTMRVPVMANPTRKGQLRLHPLSKNTGHGSNFLISPRASPLNSHSC